MNQKRFYWIVALPFLLILITYLFFQGRQRAGQADLKKDTALQSKVHYEIAGFELTEYLKGKKRVRIKAERATIRPKQIAFFRTPLIKETYMLKPEIYYYADNKEVSYIKGNSGKLNMASKRISLKGSVEVEASGDKQLYAKTMALDPNSGVLSVRGSFTFKKGNNVIRGVGLKSDIELKNLQIKIRRVKR